MFLFFESIKIIDGVAKNLSDHQKRLDRTFQDNFSSKSDFNLVQLINVPQEYKSGTVKCKFEYNQSAYKISFVDYNLKLVRTLKIVHHDNLNYECKYINRSEIDNLMLYKGEYDDILIIKNNLVTDISFANIVFLDGKDWVTPRIPLLDGTCRSRMINQNLIIPLDIREEDIRRFEVFAIINAMRGEDLSENNPISNIY